MATFTITVDRLRLYAHHGVAEQERLVGNDFEVSVSLTISADSFTDDDLCATISYAEIVEVVRNVMTTRLQLLETVAMHIQTELKSLFPQILEGSVTVAKLTPPIPSAQMNCASVTLKF